MDKLNRSFELSIQAVDGEEVKFSLPYTIEFSVSRNNLSSPNVASISIYNLAAETRNRLRQDLVDMNVTRYVILKVGYGSTQSTIFSGTLNQCWSARQGPNFVTYISARDNGYVYSDTRIDVQWSANQSYQSILPDVLAQLKQNGVTAGVIGEIEGKWFKAGAFSGRVMQFLEILTGNNVFIDSNRLFILKDGDSYIGPYSEINDKTGLIGTPILENTFLRCDIVLEPRILVGQKITVDTKTGSNPTRESSFFKVTNFNGDYKVTGIKHNGTISPTVAGTAITSLSSPVRRV